MKVDVRVVFAAVALALGACQGGFDSGSGGMGGMSGMGPPMQQPGPFGSTGPGGEMQGPAIGPNGMPELTAPGATLAPNEAQFPVADGPNGLKCPLVMLSGQTYECTVTFNIPPPSPSPSPTGSAKPTPSPTPTPTPTPKPTGSSDDDVTADDSPSPSPTPPGTITMQTEALPKDLPPMNNPDPRALRVTPLVAIRLQSDTNFLLKDGTMVSYTLPQAQFSQRCFTIQLYNETVIRGKRTDIFLAGYSKWISPSNDTVQFNFNTPRITVRRGQIWLLALYGYQYAPGATPSPSPSPTPVSSPSPSSSPAPSPTPTH